jgi:hypothetical protein
MQQPTVSKGHHGQNLDHCREYDARSWITAQRSVPDRTFNVKPESGPKNLSDVSIHTGQLFPTAKSGAYHLKGLSHEIFGPVNWPVWMHIGLDKNCFWFLNVKEAPRYEAAILSFYAFQLKLHRRFLESRRRIGKWACGSPIFVDFWLAVLGETLLMGVNISRRIVESLRMIGNWVPSSRRRIGNWVPSSRRRIGN